MVYTYYNSNSGDRRITGVEKLGGDSASLSNAAGDLLSKAYDGLAGSAHFVGKA